MNTILGFTHLALQKNTDSTEKDQYLKKIHAYEEDIQSALDSGMNAHIAKPFDPVQLTQTLHQQIHGYTL